jgi:autophagy-related protein 17
MASESPASSSRLAASPSLPASTTASPPEDEEISIPVETLVQYLIDAKRSLSSSISFVFRANELVHNARQSHEESLILSAQTQFLQQGISKQGQLLHRVRKTMTRTYDNGKREFKQVIKSLDGTHQRLEDMMAVLRDRTVDSAFRPDGEEPKTLVDFIDESNVDRLMNALKENIGALQVCSHPGQHQLSSTRTSN